MKTAMETIRLDFVPFHTDDEKRQTTLLTELGKVWKDRENTCRSILIQISSAVKSVSIVEPPPADIVKEADMNITKAFNRMKEQLKFPTELRTDVTGDELSDKISFLNNIEDPNSATVSILTNEEEVKNFWLRKSKQWKSEGDFNNPIDAKVVRKLVMDVPLETVKLPGTLSLLEGDFINTIIRADVKNIQLTDHAKTCVWIVTVHRDSSLNTLLDEITKDSEKWKSFDKVDRNIEFCRNFGVFYNKLSVIDPQKQAPKLPKCVILHDEDYINYVREVTKGNENLHYVGKAMIKLTIEDKIWTTTTLVPEENTS